jgi:tRNA(fMet)-specific endonuclease VapC
MFFKGQFGLKEKFKQVGFSECGISEITLAELIYGAEKSTNIIKNKQVVYEFATK